MFGESLAMKEGHDDDHTASDLRFRHLVLEPGADLRPLRMLTMAEPETIVSIASDLRVERLAQLLADEQDAGYVEQHELAGMGTEPGTPWEGLREFERAIYRRMARAVVREMGR